MKRSPFLRMAFVSVAAAALCASWANGAELQLMAPNNFTVVRGAVNFQIKPKLEAEERFFENPDIILQNETGEELQKVPAYMDMKTGVCSARIDTRAIPDGRYVAEVTYRCLTGVDEPRTTSEFLTLGVRNSTAKPARFTVKVADQVFDDEHPAEVNVKVLDRKGKPFPAARVAFVVNRGEVDSDAEITDSAGEATTSLECEQGGVTTLTVTVENLPPVKLTVRFKAG